MADAFFLWQDLLRLMLVAGVVSLASWAARRGGHRVSGLISGMPVIVGPITGFLLLEHDASHVGHITLATLRSLPATLSHTLVFAWLSRWVSWPVCLAGATLSHFALGSALLSIEFPVWATLALALATLSLAPQVMPRPAPSTQGSPAGVHIPPTEIGLRAIAAATLAGTILYSARHLNTALSGLLMAIPIAGSVLPCFTASQYGHDATVVLLRGFARGLRSFAVFLIALYATLMLFAWPAGLSFVLSTLAALAWAQWARRR